MSHGRSSASDGTYATWLLREHGLNLDDEAAVRAAADQEFDPVADAGAAAAAAPFLVAGDASSSASEDASMGHSEEFDTLIELFLAGTISAKVLQRL